MKSPLIPCSAANLIERALVSGSHICGCGFCTGCGKTCSSFSVVVVASTGLPAEYMSGSPSASTSSRRRPALSSSGNRRSSACGSSWCRSAGPRRTRRGARRTARVQHFIMIVSDLLEGLAVAFLVLDRGAVGPAERLGLARLVAAADAELQPAAADHVAMSRSARRAAPGGARR